VVFIPEEVHLACYCGRGDKERHRREVLSLYGSLNNMRRAGRECF
jgi:hypothetical protein